MYLKALEIQGFKSFPQKTRLTFEKDITAIVGPNGSGKSNISDAIRWVMGEQSTKALRGGKMEDVIFGGTEKRAQVGFAEVSLILDNSGNTFNIESTEVMITRRYYRSGNSEYYINKKSCRLRDVNELLMDTGLGREGYSIIGQGRIDEILSIKSTDRREIFEEAAGISRFRHRKEEAQKKLDQSEENLLRINDKISELEMQVEPLRKQSETAKRYLILRDELRGLEISVWMENLEKLNERAAKLEKDYTAVSLEGEEAQRELEEFYTKAEELAEKVRQCDIRAEAIRENIAAAESESSENEASAAVLRATAEANSENIKRVLEELSGQETRRSGIEEQIKQHKDRVEEIEKEKALTEEQINTLAEKGKALADKAEGARELLGGSVRRENELSMALASDRSRLQVLNENISEGEASLENIKAEQNAANDRLKDAEGRLEQTEKEYKTEREKLTSLENILAGYEMRLASRKERALRNEQARVKLEMDYSALTNRINLLSEMEKDYAGYSKAVKTVMQEAERGILKGVCGTVGQLIETDDDYALAVETALGGAMQNIVVDTDEIAKNAINMLKRRDGGRATFLPVGTMRGTALSDDLSRERGFEGLASELVSCDKKYEGIILYLLGRTAVCDTIDNAIAIGRKYKNRFRIVTLDGQLVNAGGSLTGGSSSRNAGILSRANELGRLEKRGEQLKADLERARATAQSAQREFEASTGEMEITLSEKRGLEDGLLKTAGRLDQCRLVIENCTAAADDLSRQAETVATRLSKSTEEKKALEAAIEKTAAEIEAIKKETGEKSAGVEDILKEADENRLKIDEFLRLIATLDTEAASAVRAAENLEGLSRDMAGGSERQRELIDSLEKENSRLAAETELLLEKSKTALDRAEKYREDLKNAAQEKLNLEGERAKRDRRLRDMNKINR